METTEPKLLPQELMQILKLPLSRIKDQHIKDAFHLMGFRLKEFQVDRRPASALMLPAGYETKPADKGGTVSFEIHYKMEFIVRITSSSQSADIVFDNEWWDFGEGDHVFVSDVPTLGRLFIFLMDELPKHRPFKYQGPLPPAPDDTTARYQAEDYRLLVPVIVNM